MENKQTRAILFWITVCGANAMLGITYVRHEVHALCARAYPHDDALTARCEIHDLEEHDHGK